MSLPADKLAMADSIAPEQSNNSVFNHTTSQVQNKMKSTHNSLHPLNSQQTSKSDLHRTTGFKRQEQEKIKQENNRLFLRIAEAKSDLGRKELQKNAERHTSLKCKLTQMHKEGIKSFGEKMLEKLESQHKGETSLKRIKGGRPFKEVYHSLN